MSTPIIQKGQTVLFIGDSIMDAGRKYEDPASLGSGFVTMAAGLFGSLYPELGVQFHNRGIGGHRVVDLAARWQQDCIALKPDWLTVMVGINDVMRRYDQDKPTTVEQYIFGYRELLLQAVQQVGSKLIIIEPYVLPTNEMRIKCREDLDPKIHALRNMAEELGALYIPTDGLFAEARMRGGISYWAPDGVHPTPAGHALIARAWLRAVGVNIG